MSALATAPETSTVSEGVEAPGRNVQEHPTPVPAEKLTDEHREHIQRTTQRLSGRKRLVYDALHTHTYMSTAAVSRKVQRPDSFDGKDAAQKWQATIVHVLGELRKEGLVVWQPKVGGRGGEMLWLKTCYTLLIPQAPSKRGRRAGNGAQRSGKTHYRPPGSAPQSLVEAHEHLGIMENTLREMLKLITHHFDEALQEVQRSRDSLRGLDAWEKELHKKADRLARFTRDQRKMLDGI